MSGSAADVHLRHLLESARELRGPCPAASLLLSHAAALDGLTRGGGALRGLICPRCHLLSAAAFGPAGAASPPT